ncbi:beta strand repeat-containing protein [Reyranella sp.]|uniref:beta strand repeat-containing protein n=1 Tax=Reyranella sp. TaxID=1929291 RepID=UPI003BAAA27E
MRRLTAGLLLGTCLTPLGAMGQTWQGATGDYFTSSNWSPATVPTNAGTTATFGAAGVNNVSIGSGLTIGTFDFLNNAQAYTINITGGGIQFRNGSGIVNNSSAVQTIRSDVAGAAISFDAGSTAANATVISTDSNINFASNSTGGTATVSATGARINVGGTASLQNATVNVGASGSLRFLDTGSGGQASVSLTGGSELLFQSYTGAGTTIGSLSGNGTVSLGTGVDAKALAIGGNNQSTAFNGRIRQDGSIEKSGSGTLTLSGNNDYTGGTTLTSGTLAAGSSTALGTGGLTIANGATLQAAASVTLANTVTLNGAGTVDSQASTLTLNGAIGGAGSLGKTGGGTLVLGGTNNYSGGTTVSAGTLQGTTSSLQGNIANNANVTFNQAGAGTYSGNMSGSGSLTKSGTGTVTLTGTNSYTGATAVDGGTLALGNAALSSSSGVTVASGATFDITGNTGFTTIRTLGGAGTVQLNDGLVLSNAAGTFSGVIGGSGSSSGLTVAGGGTYTLTGANTYVGPSQINAGTTLALSGSGSIASTSFVGVLATATLDLSQTTSGASVGGLFAAGTVSLGGRTLTITNGSAFSGVIQDGGIAGGTAGSVVFSGSGGQDLSGVNTYTGATTITAGGLLTLSGNGSIASSSGLTLSGAGAQFDVSAANANVTIQDLTGVAGSTVQIGGNSLIVGTANSTTFAGVIDDSSGPGGGLIKQGSGTLTLSGANLYTGGTTINAGTLAIGNNSALGTGALSFSAGTTLQAAASGLSVGNAMTLNGTGTVDTQTNTLTLGGAIGGTGNLTKIGTGTLILTGNNSYTGGTTVSGGTLQGTTSSLQGAILNNATVAFNQATSGTYAGAMSGTGGLVVTGGGTVTLSGANSYTGGTTVSGGSTLVGTTSSLQGAILNNATVAFNQATSGTYAGAMSGAGGLVVTGGGTVTLSGNNSYTGGTTVSGGTLQGTTSSLQGAILNNATVAFNQATSGTYAGAMSGTGGLVVTGGGTVTLSGANSYTGGTTVSGGTLQGTTSSLQGAILNNAMVTFNQTGSGTYAGAMSGTGGMTLQGGGTLAMTGASTYSGATTVDASTLVVNGSLASAVTLSNGAMLGGTGSIGGLVSNGGVLAPGNSIGTLTVNGTFSQIGGTYVVEANAAGQADRVNVTGTATISGAVVQVVAASGNYGTSTTYTILNATGGVTGSYSGVTSNFAFLTPSLSYDANNVFLTLALQGNAFSGFGGNTVNQRNVGYALDQSYANATGDFATVVGALASLSTQQAGPALNTISGQPYADFGTFNVAANALFMNAVGQQMALARGGAGSGQRQALAEACDVAACDGTSPFSVWGSALGGLGAVQGDGNASTFTYNVGGTAAGIDYRLSPSLLVGLGAGYASGTQWVDSFQGKGWSNGVSVAAYASLVQGGAYLDALAGYAYANNQLQRQIAIPGLQPRTASGSTGANQFLGQAEAGYAFGLYAPAQATVTPFVRFQASSINQAAFTEWGADSLNLSVAQQTTTSLRTVLGADLAGSVGLGGDRRLEFGLRLGWLHEYADTTRPMTAAFAGAPGNGFTVYGATPQRDSAVIGLQAQTLVADGARLYVRYDGELGGGSDNHAFTAGLRLTW